MPKQLTYTENEKLTLNGKKLPLNNAVIKL